MGGSERRGRGLSSLTSLQVPPSDQTEAWLGLKVSADSERVKTHSKLSWQRRGRVSQREQRRKEWRSWCTRTHHLRVLIFQKAAPFLGIFLTSPPKSHTSEDSGPCLILKARIYVFYHGIYSRNNGGSGSLKLLSTKKKLCLRQHEISSPPLSSSSPSNQREGHHTTH